MTRPPRSSRAELCLGMILHSQSAVLYLAGDGVYNLIDIPSLKLHPNVRVIACKEDAMARGIDMGDWADNPDNFYELLAADMISDGSRIYAF